MNTQTLNKLDIFSGGLRLTYSNRTEEGVIRFNNNTKIFEVYTGNKDIDDNDWIGISAGTLASEDKLGSIKVGNNLFMNTKNGKMNAISVGTSKFYQHIVTVAKYSIPFDQHQEADTTLPDGTIIKGGGGDFTTITSAITFIQGLDSIDYPRDSDNQWLIYVAPGNYKENFSLLPYISIKGYGKSVTFIEPEDDTTNHITLTTDTTLMDVTIRFNNNEQLNLTLLEIDSCSGRSSCVSTTNFTNDILIKNVDLQITDINSIKCINLTKGNLKFEDSFINLSQGVHDSSQVSDIYLFNLEGTTKLDLISSKLDVKSNHQNVHCFYSDGGSINIINSFIETNENIDEIVQSTSTNYIIRSRSSDISIRNSQLINNTLYGVGLDLLDSSDTTLLNILVSDIDTLKIESNVLLLTVYYETDAPLIKLKLDKKRGLKIDGNNYKISHISYSGLLFTIKLDSDRNYSDKLFKGIDDDGTEFTGVDIRILNLVSIANTYLRANNKIINCISHNHLIETNNVTKEESDYNITGDSLVELNNYNVIHVSKDKGDFNTISQALISLGKIDTNLRYLIKVHTGVYIETQQIDLQGLNNINIIGDGKNDTEIKFLFTSQTIPSDNVLFHGSDGVIENLKITFKIDFILTSNLLVLKFGVGKKVRINNLVFDIESNNVNAIELNNCDTENIIENVKMDIKYNFLPDQPDEPTISNTVYGIKAYASNLLNLNNVEIKISPNSTFDGNLSYTGKTINNIYLKDTKLEGKHINLNLTTELVSCNLIYSEGSSYNNYIYGDSLILNSSKPTNYILNNTTSGRFIIINSNILGDFNGNNIFTTGSILTNSDDNEVHSYHTSLLSNKNESILIGNSAGDSTMGNYGLRNILIGKESGKLIEGGNDNILVGNSTGIALVDNINNILVGNSAGEKLVNNDSVMIGYNSGYNSTKQNLFLGTYSGYNMIGENNIILGNNLLNNSNISALETKEINNNIFIGNDAGIESIGNDNVCIGEGSGILDTGSRSVSIGNYTTSNNKYSSKDITLQTTGYNVNVGYLAGKELISGTRSINIGAGAGQKNNQDDNICIGYKTGNSVTGTKNIFFGNNSGENTNGNNNIGIGINTLVGLVDDTTIASDNVSIGYQAGMHIKSKNNICIGTNSISSTNTIGDDNIAIGFQSGATMKGGINCSSNILIGKRSGLICENKDNIYIGNNSGTLNKSGKSNVYIGTNAGQNAVGKESVIIGFSAGSAATTTDTIIGFNAGQGANGSQNTLIGYNVGTKCAYNNTLIGFNAGDTSTGNDNTIIGKDSGREIKSNNNVVIGSNSLTSNLPATFDGNVVVGYSSGQQIVAGGNTYIGNEAGKNNAGTDNVIVGDNAGVLASEKATKDNVIIGKEAGRNLQGDYNVVIGSGAGYSNITNKINKNLLVGYKTGELNNKYDNLLVIGNSSVSDLEETTTSYYNDSENIIIGNNSAQKVNSFGNLVIGNNSGNLITTGNSNILIGEKTGDKLVSGNRNLFLGSGKSLIYKKLGVIGNDISNTYYNTNNTTWSLLNKDFGLNNNEYGNIEFILAIPSNDTKLIGIKSRTTYEDYRFNNVNFNNNNYIIKLTGDDNDNQLKFKNFIRNFGGNNWGVYKDDNYNDLVPERSVKVGENTFTSSQIHRDNISGSTTNYKKNNCPIIFTPDDILEVKFKKSDGTDIQTIIIRVYAIIQVIRTKNDTVISSSGTINTSELTDQYANNLYEIMDERLYFDLLNDISETLGGINFVIDSGEDFSITHISSAGFYNVLGNNNLFMGLDAGNSNLGEDNLFLGYKSGKNSYIGNKNTIIGNSAGEILREGSDNTIIGEGAGKYINSIGNIVIGTETAKTSQNISNSILIGTKSANNISGSSNIIIGSNTGQNLTTNKNNIIIGNNNLYNSTTGNNNLIIGNNIDHTDLDNANGNDILMVGNKNITIVRQVGDIHRDHIYIPVEDCMIFDYNDLIKVYNKSVPNNFNYLNMVMDITYYLPTKSIVHTFPKGQCEIIIGATYLELRDYSNQLTHIQFIKYSSINSKTKNISGASYNNKRPFITLERLGIDINLDNNGIYEIFILPTISTDGLYTSIFMKKLQKDSFSINVTNLSSETKESLENVQIRINNNILILSNNPHGREESSKNIYGNNNSFLLDIQDKYIIEKVTNIIFSGTLTGVINSTDTTLTIGNGDLAPNKIFNIGDIVTRTIINNYTGIFNTGFKIIGVTDTTFTIKSYSSIDLTTLDRTNGNHLRFIKENTSSKTIMGNFNSNKVVFNGDKTDLENEKATVTVKGSLGLTDFLLLKKTDGFPANIPLVNEEAVIWLEENANEPVLKLNYRNSSGVYKTKTIGLS